MGIFQHQCPGMEVWMPGNLSAVDKTTIIIIYQVKVVAFTRIVSYPEVTDELVFGVHILYQEISR